jgi:ABC-type glycerol-3-phosphate transport system permease component
VPDLSWTALCVNRARYTDALSPKWTFALSGLIIPPAVVPTIWVLQGIGLFRTMTGLVLIEVAFGLSFSILLFRNFRSQYAAQYNLLFMNILLITIPPLLMFLVANRRIVAGLTTGALK